jgi:hypothetical protein
MLMADGVVCDQKISKVLVSCVEGFIAGHVDIIGVYQVREGKYGWKLGSRESVLLFR